MLRIYNLKLCALSKDGGPGTITRDDVANVTAGKGAVTGGESGMRHP